MPIEGTREGYLYGQKLHFRRLRGWTAGRSGGASPYKTLLCTSRTSPQPHVAGACPGGDSHMKQTGMLVVSLRGVNFGKQYGI